MSVTDVEISFFRSIRAIRFPVRQLSVLVGGNGVGKTNLYRVLELIHSAAIGNLSQELAREGGIASAMWAGERKLHEKPRIVLEVQLDDIGVNQFAPRYRIELGFPPVENGVPLTPSFPLEAQIKSESLSMLHRGRTVPLMERKGHVVRARNGDGKMVVVDDDLLDSETALSSLRGGFSEIDATRNALSRWRFYHGWRTDPGSPLRQPALPVASPILAADGSNLAAVFATLRFIQADSAALDAAIDDAFPGAELVLDMPGQTAEFAMRFPDMPKRVFAARELSDGTLQFLGLMGALLSYRLPPFIALNEPETSLHPDLLPALARLIAHSAQRTQIWVVTHSQVLADELAAQTGVLPRRVVRDDGATWLEGLTVLGEFND